MTKEELENYTPKGQLTGFPKEIITRMLECQEEQGNKRDISVFENIIRAPINFYGFSWSKTKEGWDFWNEVILKKDFNLFFERYPKKDNQDNSQEFRVGDKVYDILLQEVGVVQDITYSSSIPYGLSVEFKSGVKSYTINGCYIPEYKNPHLLHYRDDYDYNVIDFNNLPKRQEPKRWRAKKGELYYLIYLEGTGFGRGANLDKYDEDDDEYYEHGNYFKTEVEAQEVADKLNKYFQELIKEEHEKYNK